MGTRGGTNVGTRAATIVGTKGGTIVGTKGWTIVGIKGGTIVGTNGGTMGGPRGPKASALKVLSASGELVAVEGVSFARSSAESLLAESLVLRNPPDAALKLRGVPNALTSYPDGYWASARNTHRN